MNSDNISDRLDFVMLTFPLPGPGINPFDMSVGALFRLHVGEETTVAAYEVEKERVRAKLLTWGKHSPHFLYRRAELSLAMWDAWVWSGGSFTDAVPILKKTIGRTLNRQSIYHHVKSMMRAGIILDHRSRKPAKSKVAVTNTHLLGHGNVHSDAISM